MIFHETSLKGPLVIEVEPHRDDRGQFVRTWCRGEFAQHGVDTEFVQCSMSINTEHGTVRGLHWQADPHGEAKLVRCGRGAIYDVIVDIRPQSPTFGQWLGLTMTPQSGLMLYVPAGFAHGFQTLFDDTEVNYLLSAAHVADAGRGLRFDDPALGINWPLPIGRVSERDRSWPLLDAQILRQPPAGARPAPVSPAPVSVA